MFGMKRRAQNTREIASRVLELSEEVQEVKERLHSFASTVHVLDTHLPGLFEQLIDRQLIDYTPFSYRSSEARKNYIDVSELQKKVTLLLEYLDVEEKSTEARTFLVKKLESKV